MINMIWYRHPESYDVFEHCIFSFEKNVKSKIYFILVWFMLTMEEASLGKHELQRCKLKKIDLGIVM